MALPFRMHEPRELLAGGSEPLTGSGFDSGIQQAAWEEESLAAPAPAGEMDAVPAEPEGLEADPLARITWPEADTGVDAGSTLRGIAEGAGLVLALAVAGLWALRQWLVKRSLVEGAGRNVRRIDSLSLPQRCHVHLLDVQGRRVLVAIDSGGVKGVTVLPDSFEALVDAPVEEGVTPHEGLRRAAAAATDPEYA